MVKKNNDNYNKYNIQVMPTPQNESNPLSSFVSKSDEMQTECVLFNVQSDVRVTNYFNARVFHYTYICILYIVCRYMTDLNIINFKIPTITV